MDAAKNLSNNLSTIRRLKQMSLTCFSEELGISKSTLQEIERGHSPSLDTLECIARHLDIPAAALIAESLHPEQAGLMLQVLQGLDWYQQFPVAVQQEFLSLFIRLLELLTEHHQIASPHKLSLLP